MWLYKSWQNNTLFFKNNFRCLTLKVFRENLSHCRGMILSAVTICAASEFCRSPLCHFCHILAECGEAFLSLLFPHDNFQCSLFHRRHDIWLERQWQKWGREWVTLVKGRKKGEVTYLKFWLCHRTCYVVLIFYYIVHVTWTVGILLCALSFHSLWSVTGLVVYHDGCMWLVNLMVYGL